MGATGTHVKFPRQAAGCCYAARMRMLFLEFDTEAEWGVASLGPGFLAAYLRAHGHAAAFLRVAHDAGMDAIAAGVRAEAPDLIGVSLTTRQWLRARAVLGALRRVSNVPVIAGGLHPTFAPEAVLAAEGIDFVCLGEGEGALLDLVTALEAGAATEGIANIWTKGGARPLLRPPMAPIDGLPFTARDMLDERPGVVHVSTQRGCPFPCTYCAARMYDALYAERAAEDGAYGRRRSHENVLAELRAIRAAGPLHYVIFLDDTFTIHHPWVKRFCEVYGAELRVPFSLNARVETVNERMLHELAAAGCRHIVYGVESGSERVRREIMKRSATNQRFRDVFRWTREAGILATANYILATPGETMAEMRETIALHHELQPVDFAFFVFYPYPGTELFYLCRERGWLPENHLERPAVHRRSILRLPGITEADIETIYAEWTDIRARAAAGRTRAEHAAAAEDGVRARAGVA